MRGTRCGWPAEPEDLCLYKKALVIIGTGGFGREVLWLSKETKLGELRSDQHFHITVFADDSPELKGISKCDTQIIGSIEEVVEDSLVSSCYEVKFICGVGSPKIRKGFVERVEKIFPNEYNFATLIHSSVNLSHYVKIGEGTVICAGNTITTQVSIGSHVNLNLDCTVGHDTIIEDFVNVSPGVHISGYCVLQRGCDIGTGANILPRVTIGENSVVGAGSCVTKDVPPNTVVVGVPAKAIKEIK